MVDGGLVEHLELLSALPSALVGVVLGFRLGRRPRRHRNALRPVPVAVDHEHTWNSTPYLHDPALPAWLYTCTYEGCKTVLRSKVER